MPRATKKPQSLEELRLKFVKAALRRASLWWPERAAARAEGRVQRGQYRCALCQGDFKKAMIQLDHIDPVIDVRNGFVNWDEYVNRLFCAKDGFRVLCKTCHDSETNLQDEMRAFHAKRKRSKK
jgi:hypothetical protein